MSPDGSIRGTSIPEQIPIQDLTKELAISFCSALEAFRDSAPGCREHYESTFEAAILDDILHSIEQGRIVYHADRFADCIAEMEAASLVSPGLGQEMPELLSEQYGWGSCPKVFEGLGTEGADCAADLECKTEFYCAKSERDCLGICQLKKGLGGQCLENDMCQDGYLCEEVEANSGICIEEPPRKGLNESCQRNESPRCEADLVCFNQVCKAVDFVAWSKESVEIGESCSSSGPFCKADTAVCARIDNQSGRRCIGFVESGETCVTSRQCPLSDYCVKEVDDSEGLCITAPDLGEPCSEVCGYGLTCIREDLSSVPSDNDSGKCYQLRRNGEDCSSLASEQLANNLCYSHNCVDGKCAKRPSCEETPAQE